MKSIQYEIDIGKGKDRPFAKPKDLFFSQRFDNKSYFTIMNLND